MKQSETETPISDEAYGDLVASKRVIHADNIVKNYVITSMGLGIVPLPIFDLAALVATQVKMVHGLTKHYDVPFKGEIVSSLITSLLSGVLGVGVVIGAASLFKSFPVVGSLVGGGTVSVLSGALTYAVGRVFIQHFEQGGTLLNFDAKKMREHFKRELKAGKEAVQNLGSSGKSDAEEATS